MVDHHQLHFRHGARCVRSQAVVGELDFEDSVVEQFDRRSDLATVEVSLRNVIGQGDGVEQLDGVIHRTQLDQTSQRLIKKLSKNNTVICLKSAGTR